MTKNPKKQRLFGLLAGSIVLLLKKRQKKIVPKEAEFSTSTQRLGVYFSGKIRFFGRKKWIFASKQDK